MTSYRDGSNPLRPYYIPPSISETLEPPGAGPSSHPNPLAGRNVGGRYASRARDIFSDIDYKDYIADPSPSAVQSLKELIDELLWKYTSVLMAQPFEVAKTILQVRSAEVEGFPFGAGAGVRPKVPSRGPSIYDQYGDSDSDQDEPAYFTSNVPSTPTPSRPHGRRRSETPSPSRSPKISSKFPPAPEHYLAIQDPSSIMGAMSQLWQKEGAWGVWKGSNASFLYTVLQSLLENWSRSLLSALFNVPDLGVSGNVDRLVDLATPYPWASLCVAAAAAVTTALVLSPIDIIRTRLLLTPTSRQPRRTLPMLRSLPSYLCPSAIFIPTVLHSLVHPLLTLSTPLVLRTQFRIDRDLNPSAFSFAKFVSSCAALFVKLPIETVLRRGQMAVLSSPSYVKALEPAPGAAKPKAKGQAKQAPAAATSMETIVPAGKFDGPFGTMYSIVYDEGTRQTASATPPKGKGKMGVAETVFRKGQGMPGLWRGWKVSWWGLVGLWAASSIGGGGDGEF